MITGVVRDSASNSSIEKTMPASAAIAGKCKTALVDPPLATTAVAALRSDVSVMNVLAVAPSRARDATIRPQRSASFALALAVAGGSA